MDNVCPLPNDLEAPKQPCISQWPTLTSQDFTLDSSHLGLLRDSRDIVDSHADLRSRMQHDGYLFFPGLLDRSEVLAARGAITERLAERGLLDSRHPAIDAIANRSAALSNGHTSTVQPDVARGNPLLDKVLYGGRMIEFFTQYLGGSVLHFDYTWMRVIFPGPGSMSHCDVVYMGRGTHNLYTAWTPIGDVPLEMGGLMVLEGSSRHERLKNTYGRSDVDSYCLNKDGPAAKDGWQRGRSGALGKDPNRIRRSLGGRWLTSPYRAGDVLIFTMFTVHASLDNHTDRIRISCDSRYQLASEPVDDRWIGARPTGLFGGGRKGRIC